MEMEVRRLRRLGRVGDCAFIFDHRIGAGLLRALWLSVRVW